MILKTRILEFCRSQAFTELFFKLVAVYLGFLGSFFAGPLLITAFFAEEVTLGK